MPKWRKPIFQGWWHVFLAEYSGKVQVMAAAGTGNWTVHQAGTTQTGTGPGTIACPTCASGLLLVYVDNRKLPPTIESFIIGYSFRDLAEEIRFFKMIKPKFLKEHIYYTHVYHTEAEHPVGSKATYKAILPEMDGQHFVLF